MSTAATSAAAAPTHAKKRSGSPGARAASRALVEEALRTRLDSARLPRHVAIICDGNGRWAQQRSLPRFMGHRQGYLAVRQIVRDASDLGLEALTLYAFSTENWTRPKRETDFLMRLFEEGTRRELEELHQNGVRMRFSGHVEALPDSLRREIERNSLATAKNTGLVLNICMNYGGRDEILRAARRLVAEAAAGRLTPEEVTAEQFAKGLYTGDLPDPDLLIRTSGEMRLSNYLLWQIAYAEIWVTETLWPDFSTGEFIEALADFQTRSRRFGAVEPTP